MLNLCNRNHKVVQTSLVGLNKWFGSTVATRPLDGEKNGSRINARGWYQLSYDSDDLAVYQEIDKNEESFLNNSSKMSEELRYVPFHRRKNESVFTEKQFVNIDGGKLNTRWKDRILLKDPFSLIVYQQMIFEIKPKTIIELGTFRGTSAHWLGNICKIGNLNDTKIYTVDKYPQFVDNNIKNDCKNNVTFIEGDLYNLDKSMPVEWMNNLAHPWFIIEDTHIRMTTLFEHLKKCENLTKGDYVVIEDTIPYYWTDMNNGMNKLVDLKNYFGDENENKEPEWLVDTYFCDMFGYNSTFNWNGYFVKT